MGKSKSKKKAVIRPWCWYCEREFEDEKVLMQHQKAKHFKCGMCPRRLNTAGGLAVHIQQVHKLDGDALPRIDNALPGRDGYEVEIFGMEGIPAPDVADYKRRKEIELGLAAGSISQPQQKRQKIENRVLTEEELRVQLAAHKALMGQADAAPVDPSVSATVYNAAPETYSAPPEMAMPPNMPPFGGIPPGMPGAPPFPPAGLPMPGGLPFPPPPPGMMPGMPPFMPGGAPPFPPPNFGAPGIAPGLPPFNPGAMPPSSSNMSIISGMPATVGNVPGVPTGGPPGGPPPPNFIPSSATSLGIAQQGGPSSSGQGLETSGSAPAILVKPGPLTLPPCAKEQVLPEFKKPTSLKYTNPNFSPDEVRAHSSQYLYYSGSVDGPRGQKRPRAEDLI